MLWWFKARRIHLYVPAGLAVFTLLVWTFRELLVGMPSFTGGTEVLLMLFAPLPVCVALMLTLASRLPEAELSALRNVVVRDVLLVSATVMVALVIGFTSGLILDSPAAAAVGRNSALLTGLMLLVFPLIGARALMVPIAYVLLVVMEGYDAARQPRPWAILPESGDHIPAFAVTVVVLAVGMTAFSIDRSHRLRSEVG
ncbi:hypothetical protein H7827_11635 [Streptomyces sp. JH002]|uniref:hypothetical protein n=1 Tax=Streptomyces sp. JH002 TaxID=2763259 RepID=UPI003D807E72